MDTSAHADEAAEHDANRPSKRGDDAVEHGGFNLHADVHIPAEDDLGRERLCRYGARPPFSLERLRKLTGGRIAYRIKNVGRGRAKYRVMTPLELLARLAALVPPPRYPLVRYHGVLAPHSYWRLDVVPRPPAEPAKPASCVTPVKASHASSEPKPHSKAPPRSDRTHGSRAPPQRPPSGTSSLALTSSTANRSAKRGAIPEPPSPDSALAIHASGGRGATDPTVGHLTELAPNQLGVRHWSGGLLYASSPRLR